MATELEDIGWVNVLKKNVNLIYTFGRVYVPCGEPLSVKIKRTKEKGESTACPEINMGRAAKRLHVSNSVRFCALAVY